ncbi:MAG: hypothetical protein COB38_06545, partial [Gammaproteobacteria bacterium]
MLKNTNITFTGFAKMPNETSLPNDPSLNKEECLLLLASNSLSGDELISLLAARAKKIIHFLLIDNREMNEYLQQR